jgi:hypothetical protein
MLVTGRVREPATGPLTGWASPFPCHDRRPDRQLAAQCIRTARAACCPVPASRASENARNKRGRTIARPATISTWSRNQTTSHQHPAPYQSTNRR